MRNWYTFSSSRRFSNFSDILNLHLVQVWTKISDISIDISDIGGYRYDIGSRKSVEEKIEDILTISLILQ